MDLPYSLKEIVDFDTTLPSCRLMKTSCKLLAVLIHLTQFLRVHSLNSCLSSLTRSAERPIDLDDGHYGVIRERERDKALVDCKQREGWGGE